MHLKFKRGRSEPYGIAVDEQGFFYVSEEGRHYSKPGRIIKLDPSGSKILSWGEDELRRAQGVAIGPEEYSTNTRLKYPGNKYI